MIYSKYFAVIAVLFFTLGLHSQQEIKWSNGLNIKDPEKGYNIKLGGRIMYDASFYFTNEALDSQFPDHAKTGVAFRRARFFTSGNIYKIINFKMQLDFAGGVTSFKDVYIEFIQVPVLGNIRVGHFKEPFSLESQTSSNYITFMERSLTDNIQKERNSGLMAYNNFAGGKVFWALGIFRNSNNFGDDKKSTGEYNLTGRIASQVLKKNVENHRLLHLGLAISYRKPKTETFEIVARPESRLAEKYFSSGLIENPDYSLNYGLEMAAVLDKFSIQGEYIRSEISAKNRADNQTVTGFYTYVSYFLKGGKRSYKGGIYGFNKVEPESNVGEGGSGAWELSLRYSSLTSDSNDVAGLSGISLGLNWYLNPATRIMANFVMSELEDLSASQNAKSNALQFRFQIVF